MIECLLSLLEDITSASETLSVPWVLGGSLASSYYGEPRTTTDADIAIAARDDDLESLIGDFRGRFYVPESAFAITGIEGVPYNVVDIVRGVKVDIFVLGDGLLDRNQISRRVSATIPGFSGQCWITAPDDVVLRKLSWWKDAEGSDRQWRDLVEVLRAVGQSMDLDYLQTVAQELDLVEELARAMGEAAVH